jgi:hypothetical protein
MLFNTFLILTLSRLALAQRPVAGHPVFLSHLSPLFSYYPSNPTNDGEAGWDVSLQTHSTTNNNASVQWSYFGGGFDVTGNGSSLEWDLTNPGNDPVVTKSPPYSALSINFAEDDWQEATVRTNQSGDSYLDVRGYRLTSILPANRQVLYCLSIRQS